ncbi:MAG: hypothetical protein QM676_14870, partial [Novosphingobium sp.]
MEGGRNIAVANILVLWRSGSLHFYVAELKNRKLLPPRQKRRPVVALFICVLVLSFIPHRLIAAFAKSMTEPSPIVRFSTKLLQPHDRLTVFREMFARGAANADMIPLDDEIYAKGI